MYKTSWKDRIYPVIGAVIVAVVSFCVLYMGNNVGLSDNGDFRRVLLANNLEYEDESDYYYLFKQDYKMTVEGNNPVTKAFSVIKTNKYWDIYSSPHFFFIKLSKLLNLFANWHAGREETAYNIGWLAGIYIFLFAGAAWGIFTFFADMRPRLKIAVLVIFLLVFCDAGYLLYFNSFYGEPLQFVALMMLLSVGLMIYKNPTIPKVVYFYISLYFFAGSKLANVPFSIIISLMAAVIIILRKDRRFKRWVIGSAAVSIIMMIGLYASIPEWMQQDTTYQSVFFGIVKESDTVQEDLEELGVDAKYAVLANTNAYMDESEYSIDVHSDEFKRDFYDRVSKLDLVMFYFNHPARLFGKLSTAIKNTAYIRPPNLGNMTDVKMTLTDKYSIWSYLRVMLRFMYSPLIIFSVFTVLSLYIIFLDIFYIKNRRLEDPRRMYMMIGINVLIAGLWINLILPMVANGEADLQKHMFLFIHCNDIMLMTLIIGMFTMKRRNIVISLSVVGVLTAVFYVRLPVKTVTFGTFEGKPVLWNVIQTYDDGSQLLVSKKNITEMAFDDKNNLWETSDIRIWLNRDFLREFTDEETEKIESVENELLLSAEDKDMASGGNHTHFWNFTPEQVGNLSESAYHYYLSDKVFLPTLDILDDVRARGRSWILCPYAANSYMQRYINNDGFILHTDVTNKLGVRAVIKVKE